MSDPTRALDMGQWRQRLALPSGFNCQIRVILENFPLPQYQVKPGNDFGIDPKAPAPIDIYFGIGHRPGVDPLGNEITYYTTAFNKASGQLVPEVTDSQTVTIPTGQSIAPMKQLTKMTSGDLIVVLQWNYGNKIDGSAPGDSVSFPFSFYTSDGGFRGEVY